MTGQFKPLETIGTAPGQIGNLVIPVAALAVLIMTLWPENNAGS